MLMADRSEEIFYNDCTAGQQAQYKAALKPHSYKSVGYVTIAYYRTDRCRMKQYHEAACTLRSMERYSLDILDLRAGQCHTS